MVMDDWSRRNTGLPIIYTQSEVSRQEFEALKLELESLKKLLLAAKEYDAETGQPDCETDEKTELFRRLAQLVGVDLSQVFPQKPA